MSKPLYEIATAFEGIMNLVEQATDPNAEKDESLEDALSQALEAVEMDLTDKAENIIRLLASWDAEGTMVKAEESRLAKKRKVLEAKSERLRTYLRDQMERTGTKKIVTPVKNATFVVGREVVIIDDVDALPQGTFDTVSSVKPDKKLIMDRHKAGLETEGAHVERGSPSLLIR